MHTALWKLYRLRARGSIRSMVGKVKSVRGAAMTVFTLLVLGMMLVPNLVMMTGKLGRAEIMGRSADSFHEIIPVVMLLYVVLSIVTSLGERAIYFSPSDIDFLFPAPFSRRQILLYKILGSITATIFLALLFSTSMVVYIRSWPAAVVGAFLALLMINSLTMCAQLIAQNVTERAFTRSRRLLLGGLIAVAAVALSQAASRGLNRDWQETLLQARHSLVAEILLAPFTVFANIITAQRIIPDVIGWAALGAILVLGTYAIAIWLDANYLETAVRVSQQMQERKRRFMSDGIFAHQSKQTVRSSRLPQPPWLGGVGPVVWRQVIQIFRGSRRALVWAAVIVVAMGVPFAFGVRRHNELPTVLPHMIIGVVAYVTFLFSAQAPLGFRGDYERMDLLKSLPMGPLAMACGQTLALTMILTPLQWLLFAGTAIFMPAAAAELLVAGLLALPFNWILFGTDNFFFLLYPSPVLATGSEGFFKMGHVMLLMLAKVLALAASGAVAAIPGAIVYFLTGSIMAASLIGWLALLFPALGILLLVAWAFQRFDASASVSE